MSQSKRELREQRRATREAAEHSAAVATIRRRRIWRLSAAVGLAGILVAVAVVLSSSGDTPSAPAATAGAADVVKGVPEHNGVLGDAKAPLTVTEFVDLQCPVCAATSKQILPTVIDNYVRTGKAKLQLRTLHFIGADSDRAAKVAAGAARQGREWAFVESFYAVQGAENSGYVTDDFLRSVASAAGVDAAAALKYAGTAGAQAALDRADGDAQAAGVNATPTFMIRRGDGPATVLRSGPQDLSAALDKALAR